MRRSSYARFRAVRRASKRVSAPTRIERVRPAAPPEPLPVQPSLPVSQISYTLPEQLMLSLAPLAVNAEQVPWVDQIVQDNDYSGSTYPKPKVFTDLYARYSCLTVALSVLPLQTTVNSSMAAKDSKFCTSGFGTPTKLRLQWAAAAKKLAKNAGGYLSLWQGADTGPTMLTMLAPAHPNWAYASSPVIGRAGADRTQKIPLNPWSLGGIDSSVNLLDTQVGLWGNLRKTCKGPTTDLSYCAPTSSVTGWKGCGGPHWSTALQPLGDDLTITAGRLAAIMRPLGVVNWDGSLLGYDGDNIIVVLQSSWRHNCFYGPSKDDVDKYVNKRVGPPSYWLGPGTALGFGINAPNATNPSFTTSIGYITANSVVAADSGSVTVNDVTYNGTIIPISNIAFGGDNEAAFIAVDCSSTTTIDLRDGLSSVSACKFCLVTIKYGSSGSSASDTKIDPTPALNPGRHALYNTIVGGLNSKLSSTDGQLGATDAIGPPVYCRSSGRWAVLCWDDDEDTPKIWFDDKTTASLAGLSGVTGVGQMGITQGGGAQLLVIPVIAGQGQVRIYTCDPKDKSVYGPITLSDLPSTPGVNSIGGASMMPGPGYFKASTQGFDAYDAGKTGYLNKTNPNETSPTASFRHAVNGPGDFKQDAGNNRSWIGVNEAFSPIVKGDGSIAFTAGKVAHEVWSYFSMKIITTNNEEAVIGVPLVVQGDNNKKVLAVAWKGGFKGTDPWWIREGSKDWETRTEEMKGAGFSGDSNKIPFSGPLYSMGAQPKVALPNSSGEGTAQPSKDQWFARQPVGYKGRGVGIGLTGDQPFDISSNVPGFTVANMPYMVASTPGVPHTPTPLFNAPEGVNSPDLLTSSPEPALSNASLAAHIRANAYASGLGTDSAQIYPYAKSPEICDALLGVAAGSRLWSRLSGSTAAPGSLVTEDLTGFYGPPGFRAGVTGPASGYAGTISDQFHMLDFSFNQPRAWTFTGATSGMANYLSQAHPYDPPPYWAIQNRFGPEQAKPTPPPGFTWDPPPLGGAQLPTGPPDYNLLFKSNQPGAVEGLTSMPDGSLSSSAVAGGAVPWPGPGGYINPQETRVWTQLTEPWATLPEFKPWLHYTSSSAPNYAGVTGDPDQLSPADEKMVLSLRPPAQVRLPWSCMASDESSISDGTAGPTMYDMDQPLGDDGNPYGPWPSLSSINLSVTGSVWNINPVLVGGTKGGWVADGWGVSNGPTFAFGGHGGAGSLVSLGTGPQGMDLEQGAPTPAGFNSDWAGRWAWRALGHAFTMSERNTSPTTAEPEILYRGHNTLAYDTFWAGGQRARNAWSQNNPGLSMPSDTVTEKATCASCGSPQSSVPPVSLDPRFLMLQAGKTAENPNLEAGRTATVGSFPMHTELSAPSWYWSIPAAGLIDPVQDGYTGDGVAKWSTYFPYMSSVVLGSGLTRAGVGSTGGVLKQVSQVDLSGCSYCKHAYYPGNLPQAPQASTWRGNPGWYGSNFGTHAQGGSSRTMTLTPVSTAWLNPVALTPSRDYPTSRLPSPWPWQSTAVYAITGYRRDMSMGGNPTQIPVAHPYWGLTSLSDPSGGDVQRSFAWQEGGWAWVSEYPSNRFPQSITGGLGSARMARAWSSCSSAVAGLGPNPIPFKSPDNVAGDVLLFPGWTATLEALNNADVWKNYSNYFGQTGGWPPLDGGPSAFSASWPSNQSREYGSLDCRACSQLANIADVDGCKAGCSAYYTYSGYFEWPYTGCGWSFAGYTAMHFSVKVRYTNPDTSTGTTSISGSLDGTNVPVFLPEEVVRGYTSIEHAELSGNLNDCSERCSETGVRKNVSLGPYAKFPGRLCGDKKLGTTGRSVGLTEAGYLCAEELTLNEANNPPNWGLDKNGKPGFSPYNAADWPRYAPSAPLWPCAQTGAIRYDMCEASLLGRTGDPTYGWPQNKGNKNSISTGPEGPAPLNSLTGAGQVFDYTAGLANPAVSPPHPGLSATPWPTTGYAYAPQSDSYGWPKLQGGMTITSVAPTGNNVIYKSNSPEGLREHLRPQGAEMGYTWGASEWGFTMLSSQARDEIMSPSPHINILTEGIAGLEPLTAYIGSQKPPTLGLESVVGIQTGATIEYEVTLADNTSFWSPTGWAAVRNDGTPWGSNSTDKPPEGYKSSEASEDAIWISYTGNGVIKNQRSLVPYKQFLSPTTPNTRGLSAYPLVNYWFAGQHGNTSDSKVLSTWRGKPAYWSNAGGVTEAYSGGLGTVDSSNAPPFNKITLQSQSKPTRSYTLYPEQYSSVFTPGGNAYVGFSKSDGDRGILPPLFPNWGIPHSPSNTLKQSLGLYHGAASNYYLPKRTGLQGSGSSPVWLNIKDAFGARDFTGLHGSQNDTVRRWVKSGGSNYLGWDSRWTAFDTRDYKEEEVYPFVEGDFFSCVPTGFPTNAGYYDYALTGCRCNRDFSTMIQEYDTNGGVRYKTQYKDCKWFPPKFDAKKPHPIPYTGSSNLTGTPWPAYVGVPGPGWMQPNAVDPAATAYWANSGFVDAYNRATPYTSQSTIRPTVPGPYGPTANHLSLPSGCWCRLGNSDRVNKPGFGPWSYENKTNNFEDHGDFSKAEPRYVIPGTTACPRTGKTHMLRGYCAPVYAWGGTASAPVPGASQALQLGWRDTDLPGYARFDATKTYSARIFWSSYRSSLPLGSAAGGAWYGRVVGASNPYPGVGFAGQCSKYHDSWADALTGIAATGLTPAPPSQRPVHALSPYITSWSQDLAIEPTSSNPAGLGLTAFLKETVNLSTEPGSYGLTGGAGALATCGVAALTDQQINNGDRLFPDARMLSPYSQFQLYQVPMNLVMCRVGGKLHARILRACDGRICADIPLKLPWTPGDPPPWAGMLGGLSVTPLPQPKGSSAPGPSYWGNRPLLEPAYEALTGSNNPSSDPYGITGASMSLGDAVSDSGLWTGPPPRGKASAVDMARANDGPWNLWRVIWTSVTDPSDPDDQSHGVVYTGVMACSRTASSLPQSAVLVKELGGARWWAFEGELTTANGFSAYTGYADDSANGDNKIRPELLFTGGPKGLSGQVSYNGSIIEATDSLTAINWPGPAGSAGLSGMTFWGGCMGQTYVTPRPRSVPSAAVSGTPPAPGTAPAYVLKSIGGKPPPQPISASATTGPSGWIAGPLQGQNAGPGPVSSLSMAPGVGGATFTPWAVSVKHTLSNVVTICGKGGVWSNGVGWNDDEWGDSDKRKPFINTGPEAASWATWPTWP